MIESLVVCKFRDILFIIKFYDDILDLKFRIKSILAHN